MSISTVFWNATSGRFEAPVTAKEAWARTPQTLRIPGWERRGQKHLCFPMNFDCFSGTCRFLARKVHFSEERRDGEKARNRRIGLWSKEIELVSIRPQNSSFHRFSKIVLFPSAGGTFSKTSQVHSLSLFFENSAPISGGNAISGKTENRKKFQSLRRFLKMVFPPVMGTLFPTNTGNGTTCWWRSGTMPSDVSYKTQETHFWTRRSS